MIAPEILGHDNHAELCDIACVARPNSTLEQRTEIAEFSCFGKVSVEVAVLNLLSGFWA